MLLQDEMLHVPGFSWGGVEGAAPTLFAGDAIGLALVMESFGARYFSQDATPSLVLEAPIGKTLSDQAMDNLRKSWLARHSGIQNAHSTAVFI
ncbi:MAG: phage portal protein [Rickettsiales bacterium]